MAQSIGLRRKPASIVSASEEWLRLDASGAVEPAKSAFNTNANGLFAETDPFPVNTVTSGSQDELTIAPLSSGGFVVAWRTGQSVKVQVFDRHGDKIGGEFLADASNMGSPAVLGLASGGFVVGWSDLVSGEVGIWARMFDAAGNPVGGAFEVSSGTSTGNPTQPSFAALSSGGFVASWTDQDEPFSSLGIKAQIFDAAGAKAGGEFTVNTTTAMDQFFSLTGGLPGGGFVATWADQLNGYRGQIFDASGSKVGAEFAVGANNGFHNALTVLSSGNFIVALVDGNGDISGQIFSPTGAPVGGPFRLNTVTDDNHDMPTLTALPDGGFVASWREATGTTPNFFEDGEIKAQVFDANGVKIGDEFMVNVGTAGGQMTPKVVAFGSGDFAIAWVDFPTSQSEINARTYFSVDIGTNGNDSFAGTADRDFYQGLDGDDQIAGAAGNDSLSGGGGNDVLNGGDGNDQLDGGAGADAMAGGGGNDRLIGGTGNDWMEGGAGGDVFVFAGLNDSRLSALRSDGKKLMPDVITDFTSGQDKIDLSALDAVSGTVANDAFTFIGGSAFTGQAGELRYEVIEDYSHIYVDIDGDGLADMRIVAATPILTADDFVL
jgi:Ca2+-binding RTX toxin-like protein